MSQIVPPLPPVAIITGDDERRERFRFRMFQILTATLTVLIAVWFSTLGSPLVTILAWVTAKHVLVAIHMMGLHVYPRYWGEAKQ